MEAQVGINTTSPQAQLDIRSSNQATPSNTDGILIPKIDAFPIVSPGPDQHGMMVYLTTTDLGKLPGFYYWNNVFSDWISFDQPDYDFLESGSSTAPDDINDSMYHLGKVGIGVFSPTVKLDVESSSEASVVRARNIFPSAASYSTVYKSHTSTVNQTNGTISAMDNYVAPNLNTKAYGILNNFDGNTTDFIHGIRNNFSNSGTGLKYGFTNYFDAGTGGSYGLFNSFNQTSTVSLRGVYNGFNNTAGTGNFVGVENFFSGSGSGAALIGVNNAFLTTSNSNIIGMSSNIPDANTGTGPKYGVYSVIESAAGGTHYGIFSQATKNTGYAGYFLGRVAIGTTAANNYILPLSRGTNGQIMQTDGTGNVTWQDPNSALNSFAWTTTGNSGLNASTHFIGTTDSVDLVFKAYNSPSGRIGVFNTAFGLSSQINNAGSFNTSYGSGALYNPSGNSNTAIGAGAMNFINTGSNNTSVGTRSMFYVRAGSENVALGDFSMFFNQNGNRNIAIGSYALQANVSGTGNVAIGYNAGFSETGSDKLYIENSNSTTPLIYGEFNNDLFRLNSRKFLVNDPVVNGIQMILKNRSRYVHAIDANLNFGTAGGDFLMATDESNSETAGIRGDGDNISIWSPGDGNRQLRILDEDLWNDNDGNPYNNGAERAYIDAVGQYFQVSDKHQKENIQKIRNALTKVNQISGYTYQFKSDASVIEKGEKQVIASGLLAQELELILPESVNKNEFGEYHVNYSAVVPLLVEALKEQQEIIEKMQLKIQELEVKVTTLNKN
jgi:Chaperone of endosialidase